MSGISPQKPTSIWKRPVQVKFGDLATALGRVVVTGAFGQWPETASGGVDVLAALGIQENKIEAIAWVLVQRSLLQAMNDLTGECKSTFGNTEPNFKLLCEQLDHALGNSELSLTPNFFKQPKQLSILEEVKAPFRQWLQTCGLAKEAATSLADRLPRYFVLALNQQWRTNSSDYALLQNALSGPFESANERELAWMRYGAWLQRQVDEPMFAETFGLRQVYVPLRAYAEHEVKSSRPNSRGHVATNPRNPPLRHVTDLETSITDWLNRADKDDAIRVICGGPGSGKSSFGRMLAARLAEAETIPVLFVPLHQFDASRDLVESLSIFLGADLDSILPPNPLEKGNVDHQVLLIFDGLDELAMQGRVAAQVAQDFVREVQKKLLAFNRSEARIFALLSGRDLTVQATKTEFRKEGQILHVLPYFQTQEERRKHSYAGEQGLLQQDQRQLWWQTYGNLKGKSYSGLPKELNQGKLVEITSQPLLNYLVALSYDREEIDFANESNLNVIYNDLLEQVYQRDWAGYQHPTLGNIKKKDFIRILEEIAIACWHGNGRTTTIERIAKRCASGNLKRILEIFEGGANEGVTRLLTAFYFRQSGIQGSEATFEFTHKSFGEYLTARRLVFELDLIQDELARHKNDPDRGWDEKTCLKEWIILCGLTAIDEYLLSFLRDEVRLQAIGSVRQWQSMLCHLIGYMLRHGIPLEELRPRPSFLEETQQARNASEALLASLSSCAEVTQARSIINWPAPEAFGNWLVSLQGQRIESEGPIVLSCLNNLALNHCLLSIRDLQGANLRGVDLQQAYLNNSDLSGANLSGANLQETDLSGADLQRADLSGANLWGTYLDGANFWGANLRNASLQQTDIFGINLQGVDLRGADFSGVNFTGINLQGIKLQGADLQEANLKDTNLQAMNLQGANLQGANLQGANLQGTNLQRTNLQGANLTWTDLRGADLWRANLCGAILRNANCRGADFQQADLQGADLQRADLQRANFTQADLRWADLWLTDFKWGNLQQADLGYVSWDVTTCWNNVQGLETAQNLPEALRQQLGLESSGLQ